MIVDMTAKQSVAIPSVEEAAHYAPEQVVDLCRDLASTREQRDQLKQQLEWFKRQLFGSKSERRLKEVSGAQMSLGELGTDAQAGVEPKKQVIEQHTRKVSTRGGDDGAESLPFFDETRVPVETIELPAPEASDAGSSHWPRPRSWCSTTGGCVRSMPACVRICWRSSTIAPPARPPSSPRSCRSITGTAGSVTPRSPTRSSIGSCNACSASTSVASRCAAPPRKRPKTEAD